MDAPKQVTTKTKWYNKCCQYYCSKRTGTKPNGDFYYETWFGTFEECILYPTEKVKHETQK